MERLRIWVARSLLRAAIKVDDELVELYAEERVRLHRLSRLIDDFGYARVASEVRRIVDNARRIEVREVAG